jgi:formiminotetrahydrofolate cyclodeaminase
MAPYLDEPLRSYLDQLASDAPTPGGGSVAALVGALGAGLNSMVASFTVGRPKYAAVEAEVKGLHEESEKQRQRLEELVVADSEAYGEVSAAYGMPRQTKAEKQARSAAIQEALTSALAVPREAAHLCGEVLELAEKLVHKGNRNLLSDVGCAVELARAALECAALNVEINLRGLKDEAFVRQARAELEALIAQGRELRDKVWQEVLAKM